MSPRLRGPARAGAEVGRQQPVEGAGVAAFGILEHVQEGCELTLAEVQVGQGAETPETSARRTRFS